MAFKGMDPAAGNEVATAVSEAGSKIQEIVGNMTPVVSSVEWVGSDYDAFLDEWNSFIGSDLNNLITGLQDKSKTLRQHAEEQTTTSNNG